MAEQEFDPKDINKDGKVSVKEKLLDAADKANEAIGEAVDTIKEKVKEYNALTPEEKKAKQAEWNEKLTQAAERASDSVKGIVDDVKDGAEKLFHGKKE